MTDIVDVNLGPIGLNPRKRERLQEASSLSSVPGTIVRSATVEGDPETPHVGETRLFTTNGTRITSTA